MKHKSRAAKLVYNGGNVPRITAKDIKTLGLFSLYGQVPSHTSLKGPKFVQITAPKNIRKWVMIFAPHLPNDCNLEEIGMQNFLKFETKASGTKFKVWPPLQDLGKVGLTNEAKKRKQAEVHNANLQLSDLVVQRDYAVATGYPTEGLKLPPLKGRQPKAFALDCEMCLSGSTQVLTRIAIIDFDSEKCVYETFIKPDLKITDYLTQFSGVSEQMLENVQTTLGDVHKWLEANVTADDFLMGHSLESDLRVLNLNHLNCIDTAFSFPHPFGFPMKLALKYLAQRYLSEQIQASDGGHSPIEDALTCVKLIKLKQQRGPEFGIELFENAIPTTKLLSQSGMKSAIIDTDRIFWDQYGTANHYMLANDGEVVDKFGTLVKKEDEKFIFLALRNKNPQQSVINALKEVPNDTLVTLWTGTTELNSIKELLSKRKKFREEYKTKNWEEILHPWTNEDDIQLAGEIEKSKLGVLLCQVISNSETNEDEETSEISKPMGVQTRGQGKKRRFSDFAADSHDSPSSDNTSKNKKLRDT